jgi:hypothetical protein
MRRCGGVILYLPAPAIDVPWTPIMKMQAAMVRRGEHRIISTQGSSSPKAQTKAQTSLGSFFLPFPRPRHLSLSLSLSSRKDPTK